jgi:hypothetical protein
VVSSLPMIIPPRRESSAYTIVPTTIRESKAVGRPNDVHDPAAVPPAMAALLAMTEIPHPKGRSFRQKRPIPRNVSMDQLLDEWKNDASVKSVSSSLGKGSPLDFLVQPASDVSEVDELLLSVETDKEGMSLSSRSVSSDSIHSTPSLYTEESTLSTWSTPVTPAPSVMARRAARQERRERGLASPPEKCNEHPLLGVAVVEDPAEDEEAATSPPQRVSSPPSPRTKSAKQARSTLKSNLTAKFQAFKSAVGSFSNFAAPSIPSDDLLARSFFSSRYPPEMRPKGFAGVPDPALRRYLNPLPPSKSLSLSAPDFSSQLREALCAEALAADERHLAGADGTATVAPMIQMRTYSRTARATRARTTRSGSATVNPFERPEFPPPGTVPDLPPTTRQREPRENSDFLRVIVLEMNMRREGKLDSKAGGRARVWLPPRKNGDVTVTVVGENGSRIPGRWVGVTAEEL